MRLIFSTPLAVYTFDAASRQLRRLRLEDPEFYGISANASGLVLSHSCIDNSALSTHADYAASGVGNLRMYGAGAQMSFELLQPHQIECHGDFILAANSGRNCLTVFGFPNRVRHVHPTTAHWDIESGERKANHFNSVHVRDSNVYVVAHNYERFSTVWVFTWPFFDLVDVIGTSCTWAHNVMVAGRDLLICNSAAGSLYSVAEKRDIWRSEPEGFITRGLAASGDHLVVGLSAKASRGDRKNCDAAICVLDRKSMRLLERHDFPGLGSIHEIRLTEISDECHGGAPIRVPEELLE